jgi:hypothetical protein
VRTRREPMKALLIDPEHRSIEAIEIVDHETSPG